MISKDVGTIAVIYYLLLLIAAFNGIPKKGFSSCRVESVILTDYKYLLCMDMVHHGSIYICYIIKHAWALIGMG
jgi:hypothetical protein